LISLSEQGNGSFKDIGNIREAAKLHPSYSKLAKRLEIKRAVDIKLYTKQVDIQI